MYAHDGFTWDNDTTFSYKTKITFLAANYTPIEDPALLSRFSIVVPQRKLDDDLRNYVMTHPRLNVNLEPGISPPFRSINEAVDAMMGSHRPVLPLSFNLTEELKGIRGITPRIHGNIIKKILAAAWWGFWYDSEQVRGMALEQVISKRESQSGTEDKVIELLKGGWFTIQDIAGQLGIGYHQVWKTLAIIRDQPFVVVRKKDPTDKRKVYLHIEENPSNVGPMTPKDMPTEQIDLTKIKKENAREEKR